MQSERGATRSARYAPRALRMCTLHKDRKRLRPAGFASQPPVLPGSPEPDPQATLPPPGSRGMWLRVGDFEELCPCDKCLSQPAPTVEPRPACLSLALPAWLDTGKARVWCRAKEGKGRAGRCCGSSAGAFSHSRLKLLLPASVFK